MRWQQLWCAAGQSFQVPALEDQYRTAQGHRRIKQRVESVLQDQLAAEGMLVRDCADHIQCGEIRYEIRRARSDPPHEAVSQSGESAQVIGEAPDYKQRKRENGREQRRGE